MSRHQTKKHKTEKLCKDTLFHSGHQKYVACDIFMYLVLFK